MSTSAGNVGVLAETGVSGSELSLTDLTIYGENGSMVNAVGASQWLALRTAIRRQAAAEGFTTLRISGTRVAGSSGLPGHVFDTTIDLSKYK